MNFKYDTFIKKVIGIDTAEILNKAEIYKPDTKTVLDPEEIKVALQIVPRIVLNFLISNLKHLKSGDIKELDLNPIAPGRVHINKLSADVYSGTIYSMEHKRLCDFNYRSLPSIGLMIMSAFELYDIKDLEQEAPRTSSVNEDRVQDIISERLRLMRLVHEVIDNKISEREAVRSLINKKIYEMAIVQNQPEPAQKALEINLEEKPKTEESLPELKKLKKSKLKEFLDKKQEKRKKIFSVEKSVEISCEDCGSTLYKGEENLTLCVCYGEHMNNKILIKKSDSNNVSLEFPESFDADNIEMLLDSIRSSIRRK